MFWLLDFSSITPPDISRFDGLGILDTIVSFFEFVLQLAADLSGAVINFYQALVELNLYLNNLIVSAQHGTVQGLPLLGAIGTYRYLVTDPIFYLTYMLVLFGCLFTVYQLIHLLVTFFRSFLDSASGGIPGKGTLTSFIGKWLS